MRFIIVIVISGVNLVLVIIMWDYMFIKQSKLSNSPYVIKQV